MKCCESDLKSGVISGWRGGDTAEEGEGKHIHFQNSVNKTSLCGGEGGEMELI